MIAGPLAAATAGAGAGGAAGGSVGALVGWGIPEERVKRYEARNTPCCLRLGPFVGPRFFARFHWRREFTVGRA